MPIYCPKCENEMRVYLKSGQLKEIQSGVELLSYQLYFCIHCRVTYWEEYERYPFINLKEAKEAKAKEGKNAKTIKKSGGIKGIDSGNKK